MIRGNWLIFQPWSMRKIDVFCIGNCPKFALSKSLRFPILVLVDNLMRNCLLVVLLKIHYMRY